MLIASSLNILDRFSRTNDSIRDIIILLKIPELLLKKYLLNDKLMSPENGLLSTMVLKCLNLLTTNNEFEVNKADSETWEDI